MKRYFLLFILFSMTIALSAQNIRSVKGSIDLNILEIRDSLLMSSIRSMILEKNICTQTNEQSDYVYLLNIDRDSAYCFSIKCVYAPRSIMKSSLNIGFFNMEGAIFIVKGIDISDLFFSDGRKTVQYYYEYYKERKDGTLSLIIPEEDFCEWHFLYNNKQLSLLDSYWL